MNVEQVSLRASSKGHIEKYVLVTECDVTLSPSDLSAHADISRAPGVETLLFEILLEIINF